MGGFDRNTFSRLGLSHNLVQTLVEAANHSLAATSWKSYSTAERHIERAQKFTGMIMTFPFSLDSTLAYVGYLLADNSIGGRGIQGKSVEKYLSGIMMCHMQRGYCLM